MKRIKISILAVLLILGVNQSFGQAETKPVVKTISLKRGQVFDVLLLNTKKDIGDKLNNYFRDVFPIAENAGYNRLPSLGVLGSPTQGNYHPDAVVFGFWNSKDSRENFLKDVLREIPTFHQIRREIWSSFSLAYYELEQDLTFQVDPEKYNVATNYWGVDESTFQSFKGKWVDEVGKAGGRIVLELGNSQSPFGYLYDPDYLTITAWDSKEAFDVFHKRNLAMDHSSVKHVNQFIVQ